MRFGWEPRGWAPKGYRKYSIAFVVIVWASVLCALGIVPPPIWATTVSAALGILTYGNVREHHAAQGGTE